ncbi:hypothetical protein F5883DRAFT_574569 [Diaporthe sp. PMI_573]|nr:hypothetical protein F5883DRAFT_574569 [Diaporthaceae sp. PMI_573]
MDVKIEPSTQVAGAESSGPSPTCRSRRTAILMAVHESIKIKSNIQPFPSQRSSPSSSSPAFVLTLPEYEIQVRPRQPRCRICNEVAVRMTTSELNRTNAGRPYYICPSCPWGYQWVCWADTKGVSMGNPPCDCEVPSRLDTIGQSKPAKAGRAFWTCVTGNCDYYSEHMDGTPGVDYDGGFYP